ncbi:hypothetical protein ACFL9T_16840 [Thermodesulfobacteriota bacterium]
MPILNEKHDFKHPVEDDPAWSESYYFNAYDPEINAGMFTRIGIRPNEGTMDVDFTLWLPGKNLAKLRAFRPQKEMIDTLLEVGGVRYECIAPMQEWVVAATGEADILDNKGSVTGRKAAITVDMRYHALIPPIGTDGQGRMGKGASSETGKNISRGHLEQAGRWTGWIEVEGERFALKACRGNRDKSWGPRRWEGPRMWRWFAINFGDDIHFGGIRIGTEAGDLHRGWVWLDREHTSIKNWDVRTELEEDGITHRLSHVLATDKKDRVHELKADLLRVVPVLNEPGPHGRIINEGLARWTYGDRIGYGISEYLHQLDEHGRPLVPVE